MKLIFGYLAGLLFGLGLAIGGMTDPHRVHICDGRSRGNNVCRLPIGVPSPGPSVRGNVYRAHTS